MAKSSRVLGCLFPYREIKITQVVLRPTQVERYGKYTYVEVDDAKKEYFALTFDGGADGEECVMLDEKMLKELRDKIDVALGDIGNKLFVPDDKLAEKINEYLTNDVLCRDCKFRTTLECIDCCNPNITQSPLERKMRRALLEEKIEFIQQYAVNQYGYEVGYKMDGSFMNYPYPPYTVSDFYIHREGFVKGAKRELKLCIYTDGNTYHNTNERIQKDKEQDRVLQSVGYKTFRYTTDDVNNNLYSKIIPELKSIIEDVNKW